MNRLPPAGRWSRTHTMNPSSQYPCCGLNRRAFLLGGAAGAAAGAGGLAWYHQAALAGLWQDVRHRHLFTGKSVEVK